MQKKYLLYRYGKTTRKALYEEMLNAFFKQEHYKLYPARYVDDRKILLYKYTRFGQEPILYGIYNHYMRCFHNYKVSKAK